ncbi:MAG: site-specific DNA-methyltransferase, partial [Solirubrobacterales bacterium]|nr:site-specific DNA-methyltransferase [Solirubrobacterales bacterium]
MKAASPKGRLELTWMGKDMALIPSAEGRYDYEWVRPDDPRVLEVRPIEVLRQVGDRDAATDNLLVVGDSGDALRSLGTVPEWADRYLGQVKLVYLDPPFNTAQVFEHYADQLEHSVWLTMMRDRIRHLKPLLAQDASIWIHLDDAEVHRMRLLMDEEFGPDAFVCTIVWEKTPTRENRTDISRSQDYILVYAPAGRAAWKSVRNLLPPSASQLALYRNPDNDPRGPWASMPMHAMAEKGRRQSQFFTVVTPSGREVVPPPGRCWRFTEERYRAMVTEDRIWFGSDGTNAPRLKKFLVEVQQGLVPRSWWPNTEVGTTGEARDEVLRLFPGSPFSTPKPERLLRRILQIGSDPGDLVLDYFAGSGTTAAVAHKMGRRWLTIELQRSTVERFVEPRLAKVVAGADEGGITSRSERVMAPPPPPPPPP